ncbi:MAG: hypothetical protein HY958_00650 [Bacteroidia bacterium]|nr:hypothetical protein [Bacteroidia bacterium]
MRFLLLLAFVLIYSASLAQIESGRQITAGAGLYESFSAGYRINLLSNIAIGFSAGSNFRLYNHEEYYMCNAYFDWIFKKRKDPDNLSKWYVSGKIYNIVIDDPYYIWDFMAFSPCAGIYHNFTNKFGVSVDAGPVFNLVLYNERKTFDTVGWPYHVLGNVRVQVYFGL